MSSSEYFSYFVLTCIFLLIFAYRFANSKSKLKLPPGPLSLPIVGYSPFLGADPIKKLKALKEQYGSIFSLCLGTRRAIVIADFEALKEAYSKSATMARPTSLFHKMPDGLGLTSTNGVEWTEQRRFTLRALHDLFSGNSNWENIVQDGVDELVHLLEETKEEPIDVKPFLTASIANNMCNVVLGYRLHPDHPKMKTITRGICSFPKIFTKSGSIFWLPMIFRFLKKIGIDVLSSDWKNVVALNSFVREELRLRKDSMNEINENCFLERYLRKLMMDAPQEKSSFNETNLVGNIQSLLIGGNGTMRTTLLWLFCAMAVYTTVQKKVQEEIDNALGKLHKPEWSDKTTLRYTYATILECMRWRTVMPIGFQHSTVEDIKVGGFDVPKDTIIIGLLGAVQTDSKTWKDPENFLPQRFLDENGDLLTKQDGWVPFSYGKRCCPGEPPSMMALFIYFTTIMQKFTISAIVTSPQPECDNSVTLVHSPKLHHFRFISRL